MSTRKLAPTTLEGFYSVKQAAIRLGLQDPNDPASEAGERWLRDGCNRPDDGSEGPRFPHHRMSKRLVFSESQLIEIAEINAQVGTIRRRNRRPARAAA
ncbi:hypothetical protein [Streptomyces sp. SGAir0957]